MAKGGNGKEIAAAYVALHTQMPGVRKEIADALGPAANDAGKKAGFGLGGAIGGALKAGGLAVAGVAIAGLGIALVKGFTRLQAIDEARAKLTGLGHDTASVSAIMDNALASVKGTAFGLGDAATVASQLAAAQIKPGQQMESVLKSVANAAAAAGTGMGDMGSIYAKVASTGKAQNDVLQQVADRGLPIYQKLAEQLGVTTEEVFSMASAGKIGFAEFETAMTSAAGTVATEMATTLPGALDNLWASFGRIGAGLLGGIYPYLAPLVAAITSALGPIEDIAGALGEKIGSVIGPALQSVTDMLNSGLDVGGFAQLLATISPLGMAFQVLQPLLPMLLDLFMQLGTVIAGGVSTVFQALLPVLTQVAGVLAGALAQALPMLVPIIEMLGETFGQVLEAVLPLVDVLLSALLPVFSAIVPVIGMLSPIFAQIVALIMPIVEALLPVLTTLIEQLAPVVVMLVDAFLQLLTPILALLTPLLDLVGVLLPPLIQLIGFLAGEVVGRLSAALAFLMPVIMGVVNSIATYMVPIIETITNVMGGLITFITGVFTGNWNQAWEGLQAVFSGVWNGIQDIARGAVNSIIDLVNGAIEGINGLASGISDVTGGAINLSIPTIPHLAEGGMVRARPGGVPAVIGEGRWDELVLPLSPKVLGELGRGRGGSDRPISIVVHEAREDGRILGRRIGRELMMAGV